MLHFAKHHIWTCAAIAVLPALFASTARGGPSLFDPPPDDGGPFPPEAAPPDDDPLFDELPANQPTPPRRGQRPGPPGARRGPSEEERARVRQFIEKHFPGIAKLHEHRQIPPAAVQRVLPRIVRLMGEYERDQELGQLGIDELRLEFQIRRHGHDLRTALTEEEREALRAKITELVTQQFDIRQQRSRMHIKRLEKRLAELKQQVDDRDANREKFLAQEIKVRLNPPDEPEDEGPPPRGFGQRRGRAGPNR